MCAVERGNVCDGHRLVGQIGRFVDCLVNNIY